ncbi:hypothetical protein [Burkholderia pseudomallei]|uniref:hypothetical protein n=1 Tax=Burkholderia pseudomallei TaxID=28450 RepID=UPI001A9EB59F|nr:hypothetical protein [Burkholderia pseudomallei]QTB53521.1 hypothetical protein J3C54_30800 [Burkholderia pseudomallei]
MEVQVDIFETPSGNVRGLVNVFVQIKGKQVRLANATLFTDADPDIVTYVPKRLAIDEIKAVTRGLDSFVAKVGQLALAE